MSEAAIRFPRPSSRGVEAVLLRLQSLGPCPPELERRILTLGPRMDAIAAKTILQVEGAPVYRPRYVLSGWACRFRHLSDGRRQIFDVVLPGEGVGVCLRSHPLASTSAMALTPMQLVDAGPVLNGGDPDGHLSGALQAQMDADERRTLNQIMRLGRLTALERLANLLLELHGRLEVVGHADGASFPFPLTQETLADIIGLSVVHVNRTLQELRRQGLAVVERGWARLGDRAALAELADESPEDRRAAPF